MTRPRRVRDLVRAYVRTGGLTRPSRDLDLSALVRSTTAAAPVEASGEERRVLALCSRQRALSVAEIAAHVDLPPSAARIVIARLMDHGLLTTPTHPHITASHDLLKEVLDGLRALV
ncbi:DUF742 domain-containing protein [Streptomyces albipurpureus]|uniref:DUF742 domain-containing protein n=1 Tax=Streptomyces albipurpureus TaxID=2897419 RepID=A0ABT0UJG6_9ACTN|nr:DUF742 domain-containing protein [Streptomyces sp. CWNU-1]MCM2388789.1 DUF742 domain-containing protein [Streptomyces sp. CWNU-1]